MGLEAEFYVLLAVHPCIIL